MKNAILMLFVSFYLITTCNCGPLIAKNPLKNIKASIANNNSTIKDEGVTDEERKFIKEIEAKYNINNEDDDTQEDAIVQNEEDAEKVIQQQAPFPAVIAIEIVNDNTTDGKGKRTIDANLGYGYKTDNGYIYSRFDSNGNKGKFMVYPYSQHDIPPYQNKRQQTKYYTQIGNRAKGERTLVEIQPSRAYQLVPVNNHDTSNSYKLGGSVSQIRTKYERVQAVQTPPPQYETNEYSHQSEVPTTLYTTYNGGQISGLSGHFPVVMPNYYVSPSQFLNHPQYQGLGITSNDHHSLPQNNIIPVIIIRIPSSQIQNPTAELFPKLPHDNPYAMSLNNINLQSIVSQYLSSIQPQYQAPIPTAPPINKYVLQYNQPITYYDPHQSVYTPPKVNRIKYVHPSVPTYVTSPQYVHQATTTGQAHQTIRYVIPHSSPSPDAQQPISHMSLSQVYGPQIREHPTYETTGQSADNLPFSENYPDSEHTRVIYTPQYQHPTPTEPEQTVTYVTQSSTNYEPNDDPKPTAPDDQIDAYKHGGNVEAAEEEEEAPSPQKLDPQGPYNYHAHPYPKRHVTTSNEENKKNTHHSRKLVMGVHTSV